MNKNFFGVWYKKTEYTAESKWTYTIDSMAWCLLKDKEKKLRACIRLKKERIWK